MNKIDTTKWKDFYLYDDDLFDIDTGNKFDRSKMDTISNEINFIGRTAQNNGINATCAKYNDTQPYDAGCLTLALGGSVGACFIQQKPFYTSQNVIVLKPKMQISEYAKKYIATVIYKESTLHYQAFVKELNSHIKTDFTIKLPITKSGKPDFEYMGNYMKYIFEKSKQNIESIQHLSKFKNTISTGKWKNFSCSELFVAKNTGNILARDIEDGSGDTPYVTASGVNNGVVAYIDASKYDIIKAHCILIGGKTFTITYQENDFVSNDSHNFVIRTNGFEINDLVYKYLVTVIYSYFGQKYSWNDAVTKDKFLSEKIPLPTNIYDEPDWKYMENYMKNIMNNTQLKLQKLQVSNF